MALFAISDLEQYGIDLETVTLAIGPKRVINRMDGTVEIENHTLKDIIEAVKFFRSLQKGQSPSNLIKRMGFFKMTPPNSNGRHS
jgi:hypothetical protein